MVQTLCTHHGLLQDMDLLAENRSLVHAGKLLRPPEDRFDFASWTELFVLLFDNYSKIPLQAFITKSHALPYSGIH